jgi:RNA ligase
LKKCGSGFQDGGLEFNDSRRSMMNISDFMDTTLLEKHVAEKLVTRKEHPSLPLTIYNYTPRCQFSGSWDDVTEACRGLIVDAAGEIISRPFRKFFNYSTLTRPETMPENFPATVPTITKKMDGSLGILYRYDGEWAVATRGSFASDQAKWATKWFRETLDNFIWPYGWTPLVEIIYPENQIVVKYDWADLVLLSGVRNSTGEEMTREVLEELAIKNRLRLVDDFDKSIEVCTSEDIENEEGYVVAWNRPGTWPLRVKVKMETYCRLHRLLTQTNPVRVWEMLKDGLDLTTLTTDVPADFLGWINGVECFLRSSYKSVEDAALVAMLEYEGEKIITSPEQRKQFALYAATKQPLTAILFAMIDSKNYAPIVWKMVKPKYTDTFKVDEEV